MDWRPIETAPRDGSDVLLFEDDQGGAMTGYWDASLGGGCWVDNARGTYWPINASHWMPLPPPPSDDGTVPIANLGNVTF